MLAVAFVAQQWKTLLAPNSVCSCEAGLECSHLYCLLLVLHVMQHSVSWAEFKKTELCYDPKLHPSGSAVWWPDVYDRASNAQEAAEAKLPMDWKVLAPLAAREPTRPSPSAAHVSGANRSYHHSEAHLRVLRSLVPHPTFRRGTLAQLVRQEYGELMAPPPVAAATPAAANDESSEEDDCGGGLGGFAGFANVAAARPPAGPSVGAGPSSAAGPSSPTQSPMRPPPHFHPSPGSGAMDRSQGPSKYRTRSRTARQP